MTDPAAPTPGPTPTPGPSTPAGASKPGAPQPGAAPGASKPGAPQAAGPPRPAPKPFVVHRAPPGSSGPDAGLSTAARRKVQIMVLCSVPALIYAVVLLIGKIAGGPPPEPVVPRVVDRVKLGMSLTELESIGGRPDGDPVQSITFSDPPPEGHRFGLTLSCKVRFDRDDRLEAFVADARMSGLRGAPLGGDSLLRIAAGGKLRTAEDLDDTLGPGLRVAVLLDAAGRTEVFRWTDEERNGLDAFVVDGKVLKLEED